MSQAFRSSDPVTIDVDRRQPTPPRMVEPFWTFLQAASAAHIAPVSTAIAPETGAAIAVMGAVPPKQR